MFISVDDEEAFKKHIFMIKNPPESGNRGKLPQYNKAHI